MDDLFAGHAEGQAVLDAVAAAVAGLEGVGVRPTKSAVAFTRRRGFAWVWRPGQYVASDVPAVVSVALPREVVSPRWKEVVRPSPRSWMHHLEVHDPGEVDDEVVAWLREAWAAAG